MSIPQEFGPNETADVVVVGGGVIGLTIACELKLRGVSEVMLVERAQPGAEASSAAAGILAPQVEADQQDDFLQLACASRDMYPAFTDALQDETAIDVELDRTGTIYLAFTRGQEDELRGCHEWQGRAGLNVEWLSALEARQLEPNISDRVRCALRFPNDIQVENRKLIQALITANERRGVRLVAGCDVRALRVERGKVCSVETSLGVVSTPCVVLAAGAWSSFIDSPDISLPQIRIEPVRGQMLCFEARPQFARHVIYSSRGYLVPRRDGRLLAGSTIEHAGFDKSVTDEGVNAIKSMVFEIAPMLEQRPLIDVWAGFRPRAEDDFPVLGPSEEIEGLFYATGHYRNGILLAPITGKVIADAIVEGIIPSAMARFSPNRFSLAEPQSAR